MEEIHPAAPAPTRPEYRRPRSRLPGMLLVLLLVLGLWYLPRYLQRLEYARVAGSVQAIREGLPGMKLEALSKAFAQIPKMVGASVVHVDTQQRTIRGLSQQGEASGVVVDPEGYIVTNFHVIEGANRVRVRLVGGREYPAAVIGIDPQMDLAVLKIAGEDDFIALEWADSDEVEAGELVWAVGNPFGLDRSSTFGIISAKDRRIGASDTDQDFLQTDAAINPGNSGGPLVDINGRIVGINTAIIGPRNAGVGFAIPSNAARERYEELKQEYEASGRKETVRTVQQTGYLGVSLAPLTPEIRRQLDTEATEGAVVVEVMPDSPADEAGLLMGDIIVSWDGNPVETPGALTLMVARSKIGSEVEVHVIREGRQMTATVTVGDRSQAPQQQIPLDFQQ